MRPKDHRLNGDSETEREGERTTTVRQRRRMARAGGRPQ